MSPHPSTFARAWLSALIVLASACSYEFIETSSSGEDDDETSETGDATGTGESGDVDTEDPLASCGDGTRQPQEPCDGEDLGGRTCADLGFATGALACTSSCEFEVLGCTGSSGCGDQTASDEEQCDGEDLRGRSCEDFGFGEGELACTERCMIDTSGCR